jgi:hypothetical protein
MTTLGPYDYWAIEYAYKPIDAGQEKAELEPDRRRARTEPALAYADDTDAGGFGPYDGMDPLANRFDLGDDPLAYFKKRLALSRELWSASPSAAPSRPRRADPLRAAASMIRLQPAGNRGAELVAKYVGGMHVPRATCRAPGGRPSRRSSRPSSARRCSSWPAACSAPTAFASQPEFLRAHWRSTTTSGSGGRSTCGAAVPGCSWRRWTGCWRLPTAQRLLDLPAYLPESQRKGADLAQRGLCHAASARVERAQVAVGDIDQLRRNLQREHLKRLQALLTRPAPQLPPDALSLTRLHATQLQADLRAALNRAGTATPETRAHLADSLGLLTEALRATMQRS